MGSIMLCAGPVAGSSATVTRYLPSPTRRMTPRRAYLVSDTTISAAASNAWTFDIQAGGTSILTSGGTWSTKSADDGELTAGTPVALTCDSSKRVTAGQALTLVMTKSASGVDQSSSLFTVCVEFSD